MTPAESVKPHPAKILPIAEALKCEIKFHIKKLLYTVITVLLTYDLLQLYLFKMSKQFKMGSLKTHEMSSFCRFSERNAISRRVCHNSLIFEPLLVDNEFYELFRLFFLRNLCVKHLTGFSILIQKMRLIFLKKIKILEKIKIVENGTIFSFLNKIFRSYFLVFYLPWVL